MVKSVFSILGAAVVAGFALTPGVASAATAAPAAPAALAHSFSPAATGPSVPTTVTFTVSVGALTITAPDTADLASGTVDQTGAPGTDITGAVGTTTVTDNRALLAAAWTATASASDWTTGAASPAETIPATDVDYDPGAFTTTGTITPTGFPLTLSGAAQPVVTGTAGVGDNSATWDPTLTVHVPASAVGGLYTGVLTQSVS
jgi:hypothetical protein